MLGQSVFGYLARRGWSVCGTQFLKPSEANYLDACAGRGAWGPVLAAAQCEYIVNCIGVLKAAIRESDPASVEGAIRVNALFPHELAAVAAECGARVIHVSTDGVFAGGREAPYRENDPLDCTDHYSRSKALGECPAGNVLNIRCSLVGRDAVAHKGLLEWLLRQPDGGDVDGFGDQRWNGVTTLQFAKLCEALISEGAFERVRSISPVHHFCPNGAITKYDLLCAWQAVTGKRVTVRSVASGNPAGSRLLATNYSSLPAIHPIAGSWPEVLSELI
jgi:dTDP-4-dehydrorhamnose reductase